MIEFIAGVILGMFGIFFLFLFDPTFQLAILSLIVVLSLPFLYFPLKIAKLNQKREVEKLKKEYNALLLKYLTEYKK